MTEHRLTALENRIDALQAEHQQHGDLLDAVAVNVREILTNMNVMAAGLAAHTTAEAVNHAARSKILTRIFVSASAVLALLAAIYSVITGTSLQSSLWPMLKTLFGL